ncbi:ribosomal-protein-alanine N-acetyltransferase [Ketogulonicigenium robustum]|uniref:Ribosomal-protein-alanine N-acetyltransferase n=1 Tax=Ketogulonicigenium robustum TaxID=92947 RepID=A0A1W6NXV9_9RHOB|nr:GNAT family N-acetyltransferase [Ketogulonicigenium robustum]ARO14003.1 ribosomal-protein-alanine N-acetyltransferase [Ketogulonicigenium robustum]
MPPSPAELAATHAQAFTQQRPWSEAEFAALLQQTGVTLVGDARSFLLARIVADEAEILTIATAPAAQRQGLAARNLREFLASLALRGVAQVFLEVAVTNDAAQALYSRASFAQIGRRRGYYHLTDGTQVDAIVMGLDMESGKNSTDQ